MQDFANMIDFIRTYADDHHHGKEENSYLMRWSTTLGQRNKLITHGILVEHDHGRLLIRDLEEALERSKLGMKKVG